MSSRPEAGPPLRVEQTVEVARVLGAHGLQGEMVALSHSEDPDALRAATQLILDGRPGAIPHQVLVLRPRSRRKDGRWLLGLRLAGIDTRSGAELWTGAGVRISSEAVEAARGDDLYWRDLIGLVCRGPDGQSLGRVRELWATGGHDVLVVDGPAGQLLLPTVDEVLRRVDLAAGEIWVDPPEDAPAPPVRAASAPGRRRE